MMNLQNECPCVSLTPIHVFGKSGCCSYCCSNNCLQPVYLIIRSHMHIMQQGCSQIYYYALKVSSSKRVAFWVVTFGITYVILVGWDFWDLEYFVWLMHCLFEIILMVFFPPANCVYVCVCVWSFSNYFFAWCTWRSIIFNLHELTYILSVLTVKCASDWRCHARLSVSHSWGISTACCNFVKQDASSSCVNLLFLKPHVCKDHTLTSQRMENLSKCKWRDTSWH